MNKKVYFGLLKIYLLLEINKALSQFKILFIYRNTPVLISDKVLFMKAYIYYA